MPQAVEMYMLAALAHFRHKVALFKSQPHSNPKPSWPIVAHIGSVRFPFLVRFEAQDSTLAKEPMLSHSQDTPPARHHSLENAEGEWEQSLRMRSYPTQQAALLLFFGMVSALSVLWEPKVEALALNVQGKKQIMWQKGGIVLCMAEKRQIMSSSTEEKESYRDA
jgi:hypothetical protein